MTSRNCVWTLNNYTTTEVDFIKLWDCKYLVFGFEVGDEGTPHLQGYVEWKSSKRFTTMKNMNKRIHWEKRRGTAKQASDYCKKDGKFFEKGEISKQGERTDVQEVAGMVVEGMNNFEISEVVPEAIIKFGRGIELLRYVRQADRETKPNVMWYWGLTGVGKTEKATEYTPTYYIKDGTQWWNGYEQQETIIIDDFDGRWPFRDLLRLLDRYPYQGQTKGGYVKINSNNIIITCEFPPDKFWEGNTLNQITRRIDKIKEVILAGTSGSDVAEVEGNTIPQLHMSSS